MALGFLWVNFLCLIYPNLLKVRNCAIYLFVNKKKDSKNWIKKDFLLKTKLLVCETWIKKNRVVTKATLFIQGYTIYPNYEKLLVLLTCVIRSKATLFIPIFVLFLKYIYNSLFQIVYILFYFSFVNIQFTFIGTDEDGNYIRATWNILWLELLCVYKMVPCMM